MNPAASSKNRLVGSRGASGRGSLYLMLFVLPVLAVIVAAGAIVYAVAQDLRTQNREVALAQEQDTARLAVANRFNQDVAAIQNVVADTLDQAARGHADAGSLARVRTAVANQLTGLEPRLLELGSSPDAVTTIEQARQRS